MVEKKEEKEAFMEFEIVKNFEEPKTHKWKRKWWTYLISCVASQTELSQEGLRFFYFVKHRMSIPFDPQNAEHNSEVVLLHKVAFPDAEEHPIITDDWKAIGFQNSDCRTDFRGGGLQSLLNFREFITSRRSLFEQMLVLSSQGTFLPAVTSINITFFLKTALHMEPTLNSKRDLPRLCGRIALKNFTVFLRKDRETVQQLHDLLMEDIFIIWSQLLNQNKNRTIMTFNQEALDKIKKKFLVVLDSRLMSSNSEFESFYKKMKV